MIVVYQADANVRIVNDCLANDCLVDDCSEAHNIFGMNWTQIVVNILFLALLSLAVVWTVQFGNDDRQGQIIISTLILLGGLVICGFASGPDADASTILWDESNHMYTDFTIKNQTYLFWIIISYLVIWITLALSAVD